MARSSKKVRLIIWLRQQGFDVELMGDSSMHEVLCVNGSIVVRFKRKRSPLTELEYNDIATQLFDQGYDTKEYEELFLAPSPLKIKRQIPIDLMELQYDLKPNGAVIRLNSSQGCLLRICKIPVELVFDSQGNPKDFVDIEFPGKPKKKVEGKTANTITYYTLKKYDKHTVGKGIAFTVHRDDNDVDGIKKGDMVLPRDGKMFEVLEIEEFKNNFGDTGKNIGLLVKEVQ